MDKFKIAIELLKKHHFWVLCGVSVLVVLLCWTWATADLASRFDRRGSTLDGHFVAVRQIPENPGLRNERSVEATQNEHRRQKEQVLECWRILYRQQKENNPLPDVLGQDFRLHFESLKPGQEMHARFRERYLNFIERHYPTLLRLVDIRRPADEPLDQFTDELRSSRGGERRGQPGSYGDDTGPRRPAPIRPTRQGETAEELEPWVGLVEWPQPEIFDITAGWRETPTTQQVLLAQEDLWVYEALLRIIANVNTGSESHDKAWIKRINALEIGQPAAQAWVMRQQPIFAEPRPDAEQMAAGSMDFEGRDDMSAMGAPPAGMRGGMGMGGGVGMGATEMSREYGGRGDMSRGDAVSLLDGRYVDEYGMPVSAQRFETRPPYAEFKMMMVHMDLLMHQRRLPRLLTECANSAMPIEVVRVRINPGQGGQSALGEAGGTRGGLGGSRPTRPGATRPQGPRIIREGGRSDRGDSEQEQRPDYANVEVFGIIYIYNPPDLAKLGTGAAASERPGEPAVEEPGEQPPVSTPAAPHAEEPFPPGEPEPQPEPPDTPADTALQYPNNEQRP